MPTYKFTYFGGRGRGELSRMLFAAADKPFADVRIDPKSEWPALKPGLPQLTLPILEVDGKKMKLSQSLTIARYLAREFNLYGKGNIEMAMCDQILDTCIDLMTPFIPFLFMEDKDEQAKKMATFAVTTLTKYLGFLEHLVEELGKSGFAVGSSLTMADLSLFTLIEFVRGQDNLADYPRLAANRKKVAALPRIAKYLAKRPETPF